MKAFLSFCSFDSTDFLEEEFVTAQDTVVCDELSYKIADHVTAVQRAAQSSRGRIRKLADLAMEERWYSSADATVARSVMHSCGTQVWTLEVGRELEWVGVERQP